MIFVLSNILSTVTPFPSGSWDRMSQEMDQWASQWCTPRTLQKMTIVPLHDDMGKKCILRIKILFLKDAQIHQKACMYVCIYVCTIVVCSNLHWQCIPGIDMLRWLLSGQRFHCTLAAIPERHILVQNLPACLLCWSVSLIQIHTHHQLLCKMEKIHNG